MFQKAVRAWARRRRDPTSGLPRGGQSGRCRFFTPFHLPADSLIRTVPIARHASVSVTLRRSAKFAEPDNENRPGWRSRSTARREVDSWSYSALAWRIMTQTLFAFERRICARFPRAVQRVRQRPFIILNIPANGDLPPERLLQSSERRLNFGERHRADAESKPAGIFANAEGLEWHERESGLI